ncbi:colanic acid biosynthesis glycosyltransferase WcaL [Geobacillus sp. BMUD]|uniref:glycosyltransferase n=1 Tax=Geobacillus TaxID=129337 RepID=UPI0004DEF2C9|nr:MULTISPECIES: glycosyltransferase [Geobacillus]NNU84733.1 colanic acid biosynthesis glycosyltransferase WcaL [Geobacillus sp. BMUD]
MKQTIAHFLHEKMKINQRFIYNQMVHLKKYRPIMIGSFADDGSHPFPLINYYRLNDIDDFGRFAKEQNIVAIHAHHGKHAVEILPFCIAHRIPLVVSIRGRDGSAKHQSLRRNQKRYHLLKQHGALFLPVCRYLANELITLGFPPEKIQVLYGGIELDLFPYRERTIPENGDIIILSIGRLVEKKGFLTLVRAFQRVHAVHPRCRLRIIGSGKEEENIRRLVSKLKLDPFVDLLGAMDAASIAREMERAHLFCLASETASDGDIEGIPNVLKEAMASGLPVVSTNHAGIPELIEHKRTGYLAPERDDLELANGIRFFLEHPERIPSFTKKARKVIEQSFDITKQIKVQERLYDEFIKKTR